MLPTGSAVSRSVPSGTQEPPDGHRTHDARDDHADALPHLPRLGEGARPCPRTHPPACPPLSSGCPANRLPTAPIACRRRPSLSRQHRVHRPFRRSSRAAPSSPARRRLPLPAPPTPSAARAATATTWAARAATALGMVLDARARRAPAQTTEWVARAARAPKCIHAHATIAGVQRLRGDCEPLTV